jgi:hypothetical protein
MKLQWEWLHCDGIASDCKMLTECCQNRMLPKCQMLTKCCQNRMLSKYCPNIVKILSKYFQNVVTILSKYCQNDVKISKCCQMLLKMFSQFCPKIVKILSKCQNVVKSLSKYHQNDVKMSSKYQNIVKIQFALKWSVQYTTYFPSTENNSIAIWFFNKKFEFRQIKWTQNCSTSVFDPLIHTFFTLNYLFNHALYRWFRPLFIHSLRSLLQPLYSLCIDFIHT